MNVRSYILKNFRTLFPNFQPLIQFKLTIAYGFGIIFRHPLRYIGYCPVPV